MDNFGIKKVHMKKNMKKNNKYFNMILIIFYQKKFVNIYKYIFKRGEVNHLSNHLKINRDFKSSGDRT